MKRFLALSCVAFMLATDLPDTSGWMRNAMAEETQTVSAAPEETPAEQPAEEPEVTPAETPSAEPEETPAETLTAGPEETPAESPAEPEEKPEEPERRPDAVMSVNQTVALSIGRGETRIVSLKVKKREEVRVTAEGLPVVISARNDETGAGATFRSKEENGRLTDRLENTWKVAEGTYTLTVSAAETNGKGNLTLRVESVKKSGGTAPAADQEKGEAEPEAAESAEEEPVAVETADETEPAADAAPESMTGDEAQPIEETPETEPEAGQEETDAQEEPTETDPTADLNE